MEDERQQDDAEVVMKTVPQKGDILEYASERLQINDAEMVVAAVKQDGVALEYVSERLLDDTGILLEAVE